MSILAILACVLMTIGVVLSATALHKKKARLAQVGAGVILASGFVLWLVFGAAIWVLLFALLGMALALPWESKSNKSPKGRILGVAGAALAALLLAVPAIGSTNAPGGTHVTADLNASDKAAFTVDGAPNAYVPNAAKCTATTFDDVSVRPVVRGDNRWRQWEQGVSRPLKKPAKLAEIVSNGCTNPVSGYAWALMFEQLKFGNFSVKDANPWLSDFITKSQKDGLEVWLTSDHLRVTEAYTTVAQKIATLATRFTPQGTADGPSLRRWALGINAGLPLAYEVVGDPEHLEYLLLEYSSKSGMQLCIGANTGDGEPEIVNCNTAPKPGPSTSTTPGATPTPTTPGSTPTPTTTPSNPPKCPPGQTGTPPNCLEIKDGSVIPTNPYHTPAGHPTQPASQPSHPAQTANPTIAPGSGSTQTAPGATPAPQPTKSVPPAGDPTATATTCVPDPDTGKGC